MNTANGATTGRSIAHRVAAALPVGATPSTASPSAVPLLAAAPTVLPLFTTAPSVPSPFAVPRFLVPLFILLFGVVFGAGAATPAHPANPAIEWERLIRAHLHRYPLMEPADLYKLLHQAALGSEHAVRDTSSARDWMENELVTMGPGPAEPLVDSLRADGSMVRIHLRPFTAAGGDPEALLMAFIGTAARPGDSEDLRRAGEVAVQLARARALPWPDSTLTALFAGLAAKGYPAVHHSEVFVEHYRPAYRVVAGELLRGVWPVARRNSLPNKKPAGSG